MTQARDEIVSDSVCGDQRSIGVWGGSAIVAGNMIGVGIFLMPGLVADRTGTTISFLLVWAIGGLWALCGALSFAELATMYPRAGGDYVYLRKAYGRSWAFVSGWVALLVTFSGSIAVMAGLTMKYQAPTLLGDWVSNEIVGFGQGAFSLSITGSHLLAVLLIGLLTWINHRNIRWTAGFQVGVTAIALLMMLVIIGGVYGLLTGEVVLPAQAPSIWPSASVLALAFLPVYFAYAGWNAVSYVAGEVDRPNRNLPLSLILGTLVVTVVYVMICFAYTLAVPVSSMGQVFNVGTAAASLFLHDLAGPVVDLLIIIAVAGSLNATILSGSRIYLAMARDRSFFSFAGRIHPKYKTPTHSLWLQAAWASLLVFISTVETILDYAVTLMLVLSIMSVGAVIVLRLKCPAAKRPYRCWGYPLTPLVYIGISLLVLWGAFLREPAYGAWIGIGVGALGMALYWLVFRGRYR